MKFSKITRMLLCYLLSMLAISCSNSSSEDKKSIIDSLNLEIESQANYISYLKEKYPLVDVLDIEAGNCTIISYKPFGLRLNLKHERPQNNNDNYLCVPAAYTSKQIKIDGLFIEEGKIISNSTNDLLTGFCIINDSNMLIVERDSLSKIQINHIIKNKGSLFQQSLLIKNNEIFPCDLFGKTKNIRRALIQFDNFYCIGESHRALTIHEFQVALLNIGALNAVNLDMGTWSEGWYKNQKNEKIVIGESFLSTVNQTNWIVFEK